MNSRIKNQELILMLNGFKPVVRHLYEESFLPYVEKFANDHNLFLEQANFRVQINDSTPFSNYGTRSKQGHHVVYLSRTPSYTILAKKAEEANDHFSLGLLLGYPPCCVDFFISKYPQINPVHAPTNPYTNITKRDQDLAILSHFPCHSDCQASITLAKNYLKVLSPYLLDSLKINK